MLIGEAIQRVKHLYNKGVPANESRLSNRYVYSKLRSTRIRVLSQEARKNQMINEWSYQTIPCLPMMIAHTHECPCVPWDGCDILRSEFKLPEIFTDHNRHLIKSVSHIDGSKEFNYTTWMNTKNKKGNKFTSKKPEYFIHNGYLFVIVNITLEVIAMVALFNDPLEAALAEDYCDNVQDPCKSYMNYNFHLDGKLEESVIQLTVEEIVYIYAQMREDKLNNASDETGAAIPNPRSYRDTTANINRNVRG